MIRRAPEPGILSGLAFAACLALPDVAVAQTPPAAVSAGAAAHTHAEQGGHSIGASISEARQSPFHSSPGMNAHGVFTPAGSGLAPPPPVPLDTPANDGLPSFGLVFPPTLLMTFLADFATYWALICGAYGGGGGCIDSEQANLAIAVTAPVLVPALVASAFGTPFVPSLLGSALGAAAGVMMMQGMDPDTGPIWMIPLVHASATTLGGLLFGRGGK